MNFFVRTIGVVAVAALLVSCGGGGGDATATTTPGGGGGGGGGGSGSCTGGDFCMNAATFSPTTLSVAHGSTVTWSNSSAITHNVTFDNPSNVTGGNIPDFASGSQTRSFPVAGTYHFICTIHGPTMSATLTVF
jgi:plastocyanin